MTDKHYAIEIDGFMAGWLRAVDIPELTRDGTRPGSAGGPARPLAASFSIAESGVLLDWIRGTLRGEKPALSGAIVAAGDDLVATRRVDWTEGYITELKFPSLVAKEDRPFTVDLKWQPSTVEYAKGSGKISATQGARQGPSISMFRFQGLPGDTDYIIRVDLPTIKVGAPATGRRPRRPREGDYANIDIGEVKLEFAARSRDSVLGYVQKVIRDGKLTDNEYLDFGIELLDPTRTRTLATIQLYGCGLRSSGDLLEANRKETATFTLDFTVERFDLKMNETTG